MEKIKAYRNEIRELYIDRMKETEEGNKLMKDPLLNTFESALKHSFLFKEEEQEVILWCLANAVIDASETDVYQNLIDKGITLLDLELSYPDSIPNYGIVEDFIYVSVKSIVSFEISFSVKQFLDDQYLLDKWENIFLVTEKQLNSK